MTVTTASIAAASHIAAVLIDRYGWTVSVAGAAADKRTANGVISFGHDGTLVHFYRRHETGYMLADLELGAVDLGGAPAAAAAQVVSLLA